MKLKQYQIDTLDSLDNYVGALAEEVARNQRLLANAASLLAEDQAEYVAAIAPPAVKAWKKIQADGKTASPFEWRTLADGHGGEVPHVCLQLPTGSGKTLIASHAAGRIFAGLDKARAGFVLWIVPSEAIYKQTRAAMRDRGHPLRQALEVASGGRVKLLEKATTLRPPT